MNITLRAGERIYVNGAVLRVDRKATIELLNDATFLLETHVMQAADATTPLRQIYFAVQVMLMDPSSAQSTIALTRELLTKASEAFESLEVKSALRAVSELIGRSRYFDALKAIRGLYALEREEMQSESEADAPRAA